MFKRQPVPSRDLNENCVDTRDIEKTGGVYFSDKYWFLHRL